uniref:Uncharacterized protein n=1 Tax=Oryza nivara TaxID=4536 RepID=A0A0E0IAT1_ORYNI
MRAKTSPPPKKSPSSSFAAPNTPVDRRSLPPQSTFRLPPHIVSPTCTQQISTQNPISPPPTAMSRRTKRLVAPPPRTIASSSGPPGVPLPSAAPYSYGGPWFPTPPPGWFAPPSQAMPSSSACPLSAAGKTNINVQLDLEEWILLCWPLHSTELLTGTPVRVVAAEHYGS